MIIKYFELNKLNKKNYKIILLHGNNQGLKDEIIHKHFCENFDGKITKYEENDLLNNQNDFINSLINISLFEKEKLIIVSRVTEKIINILLEIINRNITDTSIILQSNALEKKSKLRNLFEKEKSLVSIPIYEDDTKNLNLLIREFLIKKEIKLSQETINLIIERSKGDRKNLKNELSKLENLAFTKKNISLEDIQQLTNLAENYSVFELSDNYLAKNLKKVSNILNENNYNSDDCILILRTILNKSKRLLMLKYQLDSNKNIDLVLSSFKPPIFWKEKEIVKKQLKSWSNKEIKKIIYKINDLELVIKNNSTNSINYISDFVSNY